MLFTLAFSEWFTEARGRDGRSLRNLASLLGVSHTTVSKWEHGRMVPSDDHLRRIADLFGVEFESIRLRAVIQDGRLDVTGVPDADVQSLIEQRDAARDRASGPE